MQEVNFSFDVMICLWSYAPFKIKLFCLFNTYSAIHYSIVKKSGSVEYVNLLTFSFIILCLYPSPTVFYRYTIEDLSNANMYLVSFSVLSCWESSSHCEQYTVLSNTRLPKSRSQPYCNWKAEETIPGKRELFSEYRTL